MSRKSIFGILLLVGVSMIIMASPALVSAKGPVTLKAVTFQGKHVSFVDAFFIFQKRLNKEANGKIAINYVGGPEAIPPFEQIEAVKSGLVDMALLPAAYYVPHMPLADAVKLSRITPWKERETGAYDLLKKLNQEKVNAYYLARVSNGVQFHLYLNKKIDKPDFSGLKIRVTPIYKPFVKAMGGITVTTAPGEVYTALERGVVDGYGWPSIRISDFGWHEVTKYVVDPGFYQVDVSILVNLDVWNRLSKNLQELLISVGKKVEHEASDHFAKLIKGERDFILSKGVKVIRFSPEGEKKYLEMAYEAGWDQVLAKRPVLGAKLRKLLQ